MRYQDGGLLLGNARQKLVGRRAKKAEKTAEFTLNCFPKTQLWSRVPNAHWAMRGSAQYKVVSSRPQMPSFVFICPARHWPHVMTELSTRNVPSDLHGKLKGWEGLGFRIRSGSRVITPRKIRRKWTVAMRRPFSDEINWNCIQRFRSYRAVETLHLWILPSSEYYAA